MCLGRAIAVAFGLTFLVNEASGAKGVFSKEEIMANMTPELAFQTVLSINRTRMHPELMALLYNDFGYMLRSGGVREEGKRKVSLLELSHGLRGAGGLKSTSRDPAGIDKATIMLNMMGEQTIANLEQEEHRCQEYDRRTTKQMRQMRNAISQLNAQAASARAEVVKATGDIATYTTAVQQAEEEEARSRKDCKDQIDQLKDQLKVVLEDLKIMATILDATKCNSSSQHRPLFLVQCRHCQNAVMLKHGQVQPMLAKLQSGVARLYVHNALAVSYEESVDGQKPMALAQQDVELMGRQRLAAPPTEAPVAEGGLNMSGWPDQPEPEPEPVDCQPTTKCTIGENPNCQKLKDRFLNVETGLMDKRDELKGSIGAKQEFCEAQFERFTSQIDGMNTKLREAQTKLASGTEDQNQAERSSHDTSSQFESTSNEHTKGMEACCDNQNKAKSELCAFEKIRGELLKMEKKSVVNMTDCVVSEWRPQDCSASCGGGTLKKTRGILVQSEGGGMACPPLEATESCNEDDCPVDCELDDWGGWSSCSADCGGGVMQRSRAIKVEPSCGGAPCEQTSDTQSCNIQSCDVDCTLSDWSSWSACTKACGGGSQTRSKSIAEPAHGMGNCFKLDAPERSGQQQCNAAACNTLITDPQRQILRCNSMVDVIILLDGSASIGENGWMQATRAVSTLVQSLGHDGTANLGVLVFAGPESLDGYTRCVGDPNGTKVDMEQDCGMEWVSHLTSNTAQLSASIPQHPWPRGTTMTSLALGQAESELFKGREDANSVVILVTDGRPMSQTNTKSAAARLQQYAKVLYVPVGSEPDLELIGEMAAEPKTDHIFEVQNFRSLGMPQALNQLIASTCLSVY